MSAETPHCIRVTIYLGYRRGEDEGTPVGNVVQSYV